MAETIADIIIGSDEFVSLNSLSGIAVGIEYTIQNKGSNAILLIESAVKPSATITDGALLTTADMNYAVALIPAGSLEIWARSQQSTSKVTIQ